ncbi:hypothetical protein [Roseiflexus sp.]|uniref:hypothetical protein n=1 Tax=Roseiflexus sp. TaxID=2562120 RepID=UPI00398B0027
MSAPRIETLLISLIVLVATGVALAAAYAPPAPRQPQAEILQKALDDTTEASNAPPGEQRSYDRSAVSDAVSVVVDMAIQQIGQLDADGRIALPAMSGVVALMLAIVAARRRRHVAGATCWRRSEIRRSASAWEWGASILRWRAMTLRRAQTRSGVGYRLPVFPGAIRAMQRGRGVPLQYRKRRTLNNGVLGTSLRSIIRFGHQVASASHFVGWGAGDRVDEGNKALDCGKHIRTLQNLSPKDREDDRTEAPGCEQHIPHLNNTAPTSEKEELLVDQTADSYCVTAALQQSDAQSAPGATGDYQSITTDRAIAVVAAVLDICERQELAQSVITFAEASVERQWMQVRLMVAAHPNETRALGALPEQVQTLLPRSRAQWRRATQAQPVLAITLHGDISTMRGGHLLMPIARHRFDSRLPAIRRSTPAVSLAPLRAWRHLGFYGGKAIESASSALIDLLYTEAPDMLAVTIIDHGQISSFCQGAPHLVPTPGAAADSLIALGHAVRSFQHPGSAVRSLLIVLVEPDTTVLKIHADLVARLLRRPDMPVYTVLVQTRVPDAAQRQHTHLPAVVTGGGSGQSLGTGGSPPAGTVRILAPHIRLERQCHVYDAAHLAVLAALLRTSSVEPLPATVWDTLQTS